MGSTSKWRYSTRQRKDDDQDSFFTAFGAFGVVYLKDVRIVEEMSDGTIRMEESSDESGVGPGQVIE